MIVPGANDVFRPPAALVTTSKFAPSNERTRTGKVSSLVEYPTAATKTAVDYLETIPNDLNFYEAHKRLSKVKAIYLFKRFYEKNYNINNDFINCSDLFKIRKRE